jgi:AcrR family transcriptional regulator
LSRILLHVPTEAELRRDAVANRERILDTASRLFADRGLEMSMDEIARTAGVGPATLYRRFPTKEALLDAVLGDVLERFLAFAQEALENDDAYAGLNSPRRADAFGRSSNDSSHVRKSRGRSGPISLPQTSPSCSGNWVASST